MSNGESFEEFNMKDFIFPPKQILSVLPALYNLDFNEISPVGLLLA